jgi:hypothetical protein
MPSAEFEPAIPATKRPQTYALDRAATGIGNEVHYTVHKMWNVLFSAIRAQCIWRQTSFLDSFSSTVPSHATALAGSKTRSQNVLPGIN